MVNTEDIVTVAFSIRRSDNGENYKTNGFQNYIHYDLTFFEFVEGSVVCFDNGAAVAKKLNSITYGEIIQCQNMDKTYSSDFVFCTFQLKVIGVTGSGMVYNDEVYAFDSKYEYATVEKSHLQAIIDSGCTHARKTKVEAQDLLAKVRGGRLITIATVVTRVRNTNTHNGGAATCGTLAECKVCGAEYGTLNADNHEEGSYLANYKITWFWGDGYTGDVCCSGCHEVREMGERVSMFNFFAWPWWIIVIFIFTFPVVIIGWLFILFVF